MILPSGAATTLLTGTNSPGHSWTAQKPLAKSRR